jgi:hypothetical protein
MNSVRHKWLATVAKTHFVSSVARLLGAIFGLKSYILS